MGSGRHLVFAAVVAAHVGVALALQLAGSDRARAAERPAIASYNIASDVEAPETAPVAFHLASVDPTRIDPPAFDVEADPAVSSATSGAASDADACDLTPAVQATLRDSAQVRRALAGLPQSDRSVANAVMLWDGRWIAAGSPATRAALASIRQVLASAVRAAPAACRAAVQAGPRLFAVSGPPDSVLALGSGRWRWDDLLAADNPQSGSKSKSQSTSTSKSTPSNIETGSD